MTPSNYQYLCAFLKRRSGIALTADKAYLAESRLSPVARRLGLASLDALADTLRAGHSPTLECAVIEAMVTNETSFYRDKIPYEQLKSWILPRFAEARSGAKRLNVWCAAGSTGQEPYSIAMTLKEMEAQFRGWRVDILATDIAQGVLEKTRAGLYSQFEVQRGLPIQQLVRHFTQEGESWRISSELRGMVHCKELNLLDDFSGLGHFDIIFCRNVLIYFDRETKANVLERLAKSLTPDGILVLGAAETIIGLTDSMRASTDNRGCYTLEAETSRAAPKVANA